MTDPVHVVAVVSFRHSGSTLLGTLLGASPSASFVGETDRVLHRRHDGPPRCRCGRPIADCERWAIDAERVARWPDRRGRDRRWFGLRHHLRRIARTRADEARVQRELWEAAASARGVSLVDSSKDLRLLRRQLADARWHVDVVHLVRDPGPAVASSIRRGAERGLGSAGQVRLTVTGLAEAGRWLTLNLLVGPMLGRRASSVRRVRFEDLGADPEATIRSLSTSTGIVAPPFDGRVVVADDPHMIRANRGVSGGRVEIREAAGSLGGLPPVARWACGLVELATRRARLGHSERTDAPVRDEGAGVGSHT